MSPAPSEKDTLDEPLLPVSRNPVPLQVHDYWSWSSWSPWKPWAVHLTFFLSYSALITVIAVLYFNSVSCNPNDQIYSPAREAVTYDDAPVFLETKLHNNPFVGAPRPELDDAWHDLLENSYVHVSEQTLQKLNRSTIALNDGSYVGGLGVYHELHCLKQIRHWIHRDYYMPNISGHALVEMELHIDHCVEFFRKSVMCTGSLDLVTVRWAKGKALPVPRFLAERRCVNWQRLDRWSADRRFWLGDIDTALKPGENPECEPGGRDVRCSSG